MQRSDVLVIGPLGRLVPRPLRVRLGLVTASLATAVGLLLVAALVLAWQAEWLPVELRTAVTQPINLAPGGAPPAGAPVPVESQPNGATILVGSRELGQTPAEVSITPGRPRGAQAGRLP